MDILSIAKLLNIFSIFRYLAITQFEPTYARTAFPCFDEPQFKAKFKISIYRDRFHIALCNMPAINTEEAGFYLGTNLVSICFVIYSIQCKNFTIGILKVSPFSMPIVSTHYCNYDITYECLHLHQPDSE